MKTTAKSDKKKTSVSESCKELNNKIAELERRLAQSEESLDVLHSEFQQITQNIRHGIRVINRDSTVRYINQSFADMSGISPADAIGKKCWEIFPGPFCHTPNCRLSRIIDGEKSIQTEIERTKLDGLRMPCIVNAVPFYSNTNEINGVIETFTDITEKRQLQNEVEETEGRYHALIELGNEAGEAIVMLQDINDKEGIQTFVSEQWLHITGYTREELLGKCFFDILEKEDRQPSIDRHRLKMSGRIVPGLYEMKIRRKDGSIRIIELTGACTTYRGNLANILYIRDVTVNREEKENLRASEENYRGLFQNVPVGILEINYSFVKPILDDIINSGVEDIRKHFSQNPDAISQCLRLTRLINANAEILKLWETNTIDELRNKMLSSHLKQLDKGDVKESFIGLAERKTSFSYVEKININKKKRKEVKVQVSVAPGYEETLSKVYVGFLDITDLQKAERKLKLYMGHLKDLVDERTSQLSLEIKKRTEAELVLKDLYSQELCSRHKLEEYIKQRTDFIWGLVHEIKTPLTPMVGASEILMNKCSDNSELSRIAQSIFIGTHNLSKRITDLTDLAMGEMGILKLNYQPIDVNSMLNEAVQYMMFEAEKKQIQLILKNMDVAPIVWGDENRLHQILVNLLSNAIKHTPQQGEIRVISSRSDDNLVIEVADNGCGIAEKYQQKLFEPYSPQKPRQKSSGLGLGLPLSKMFVEFHNGQIWFSSAEGKGSQFFFSIPIGSGEGHEDSCY